MVNAAEPIDSRRGRVSTPASSTPRTELPATAAEPAGSAQDRGQNRIELRRRLGCLGGGLGIGHNARAGPEPGVGAVELRTAQRERELSVAARIHPAHWCGVAAAGGG